jgi:hypothetical protein
MTQPAAKFTRIPPSAVPEAPFQTARWEAELREGLVVVEHHNSVAV